MRKWIFVALALILAGGVLAADLNSAKPMKYIPSGGYVVLDSVALGGNQRDYEHFYLFQAQAAEDVTIRRKFDSGWEDGPGILIKSGQSLIYDVPYTINAAGTHMVQIVFASTLTDSVDAMPWQR